MRQFRGIFSALTALALCLSLLPTAAWAAEETPAPEAPTFCTCKTLCMEGSVNADCPVCGAEGADLTLCAGTVPDTETPEEDGPVAGGEPANTDTPAPNGAPMLLDEPAVIDESGTGDFTVNGGTPGTDYTYSDNVLTVNGGADITISGTTNVDRIVVAEDAAATVTLDGVDIQFDDGTANYDSGDVRDAGTCALWINEGANLTLTLVGTNTLKSGAGWAGINVSATASVTIGGTGTLNVTGGNCAAGIGGGLWNNAGSITIESGTINATGTADGAGIGGGHANDNLERPYGGFAGITITGGTVTATATGNAAGIGTGCWSKQPGKITIENAVVTASSDGDAGACAAIGRGLTPSDAADITCTVIITGSIVSAANASGAAINTGSEAGAAITNSLVAQGTGSANSYEAYGSVTLPGDFTLAAGQMLAIGSGDTLNLGGHTLTNNGTIDNGGTVTGSGTLNNSGTVEINQGGALNVVGSVTNSGALQIHSDGSWTVNGSVTNSGTIDNSGTVTGSGSIANNGAFFNLGTLGETVTVTGNDPISTTSGYYTYLDSDGARHTIENAEMIRYNTTAWGNREDTGAQWYVALGNFTINQRVTVTGDVRLILADVCNLTVNGGIQVQDDDGDPGTPRANSLTIYAQSEDTDTMGALTAAASGNDAGIGGNGNAGGYGSTGGTVIINGGVVTARGSGSSYGGGAGIGGGGGAVSGNLGFSGGSGGIVTINGGVVTAIGGNGAGFRNAGGAGIGGGGSSGASYSSAAGTVTINGGVVTATGGDGNGAGNGAAIGSGGRVGADGTEIADAAFTNCVVFRGNTGTVYGKATLEQDLTVKSGQTLTIPEETSLTIPKGVTLTVLGTLTVQGTLINNGTFVDVNGVTHAGNGLKESPYQIPDLTTLVYYRDKINGNDADAGSYRSAHYELTADIDMSETYHSGENGQSWTPIGSYSIQFSGNFNGNHKTISNLYIYNTNSTHVGLFGYTDNAVITNLHIKNANISNTNCSSIGGVVGYCVNGSISGCSFSGSISSSSASAGGIVGYVKGTTITQCTVSGAVNGSSAGGIVGHAEGTISYCSSYASVVAKYNAGGIVGDLSGSVEYCHSNEGVSHHYPGGYSGGIVGRMSGAPYSTYTIQSCYSLSQGTGGAIIGNTQVDVSVNNCYYLAGTETADSGTGAGKTADQFASGEVAYLLQSAQTAGDDGTVPQVWGQVINTDSAPVLTSNSGLKVYLLTFQAAEDEDPPYAVLYGNSGNVPAPADPPTPEGYTFAGWDGYSANMLLTADTTFTALWTSNTPSGGDEEEEPDTPSRPSSGGSSKPSYAPSVDAGDGGEVSTNPRTPHEGDDVTITVEPDEGYEVDEVIVTDRNGSKIDVTDNGDGTYTFEQPRGRVTISVTFRPIQQEPLPFTDVAEGTWYYDAVAYAYANGLMSGTSSTTFAPDVTTSRGMIAAILWRMADSPVVNYLMDYDDVAEGSWYAEAIRWATSAGVVGGYGNGTFGPNDPITREQMAVMLYRYAQHMGYDVTARADLTGYIDADQISGYAAEALAWANVEGIVNGTSDTTLAPKGSATRAQAAVMLMRFCQRYIGNME